MGYREPEFRVAPTSESSSGSSSASIASFTKDSQTDTENDNSNNRLEKILEVLKEKSVEEFKLLLSVSLKDPELKKNKDEEESDKARQAIAKLEEEQMAVVHSMEDYDDYNLNMKSDNNDLLSGLYISSYLPNKPQSIEDIILLPQEFITSDLASSTFTGAVLLGLLVMNTHSNIGDSDIENIDLQLGII